VTPPVSVALSDVDFGRELSPRFSPSAGTPHNAPGTEHHGLCEASGNATNRAEGVLRTSPDRDCHDAGRSFSTQSPAGTLKRYPRAGVAALPGEWAIRDPEHPTGPVTRLSERGMRVADVTER
jgi:hypothetical protein